MQRSAAVRTIWPSDGGVAAPTGGLTALARTATLYGQTITPALFYVGAAYNGTTWTGDAGPTLVLAGSGAAPAVVDAPTEAVAPEDAAVRTGYGTGKHFSSTPDTTSGDVVGEDMVVEIWIKPGSNNPEFCFSKRGSTTQGWFVYTNGTSVALSLRHSSTTVALAVSSAVATWVHMVYAVDRSSATGFWAAKNGVQHGTTADPTALTTLTSSTPVFICAANSSGTFCSGDIALAAMWKASGWLDASNKTEVTSWALARYNQAMGV